MFAMKRLAAAVVVLLLSGAATAPAEADIPPTTDCTIVDQLDCTMSVLNWFDGRAFCQQIAGQPARCELFWPFRNPTISSFRALDVAGAFPDDYASDKAALVAAEKQVGTLERKVQRRDVRIQRLEKQVRRLEAQVKRLKNRNR